MTNGNESDTSLRRDKRARFDDANVAATSQSPGTKFPAMATNHPQSTPFEAGEAVYSRYIATLQDDLQHLLRKHAYAVYQAFATYFQKNEQYGKEKNDPSFIPKPCNISITLQPRQSVEKAQGFKELARETENVVNQCRQLLKVQYMKNTDMNVASYKEDISKEFAKALPAIAEVFMAQEDVEGESPHTIIADLLRFERARTISFLKVTDHAFAATYCAANGLANFPQAREPPLFTTTATVPVPGAAAPLYQRGGSPNFAIDANTEEGANRPPIATPGETPANMQNNRQAGGESPDETARQLAAELEAIAADDNSNPRPPPMPRFDYVEGEGTQQSSSSSASGEDSKEEEHNEKGTADDAVMADATDRREGGNNNNTATAGGQQLPGFVSARVEANRQRQQYLQQQQQQRQAQQRAVQQQQQLAQAQQHQAQTPMPRAPAALSPAQQRLRHKLTKIHNIMLEVVEYCFVKPRRVYQEQVKRNAQKTRIKKVVKRLTTTKLADDVATAIAAERPICPKTVKILIREEVRAAANEATSKPKGKGRAKKPKNSTGAQRKGGAHTKKKSPSKQPINTASDSHPGKDTVTAGKKGKGGKPSATVQSRKKGQKVRTKTNKSNKQSKGK